MAQACLAPRTKARDLLTERAIQYLRLPADVKSRIHERSRPGRAVATHPDRRSFLETILTVHLLPCRAENIGVFTSDQSAAVPAKPRMSHEDQRAIEKGTRRRLPITPTVSSNCKASSADRSRWVYHASAAHRDLRITMPPNTQRSSNRGLSWLFDKYGFKRAICLSVSQYRSLFLGLLAKPESDCASHINRS